MKNSDYTMHVISHTHWDREFYLPFQEFRVRFVEVMDDLLDLLDKDPDFKCFHLDGQTVIIDDYLEIKPDNKPRIEKFVKQGRLQAGPKYQLNDHFLVSAEAHVRNHLIGIRAAKEWGRCMMIGYCPDEFGLISQYPQILRGFDIDNAIIARGIYIEKGRKTEFTWESPDGSQVLSVLLAMWFNNAQHVQVNDEDADKLVERVRGFFEHITITPHVPLLNGVDQMAAQPDVGQAIRKLNSRLDGDSITHSSLPAFIDAVRTSLEQLGAELEVFRGELREDRFGHALAGTLSTRMYLKQANDQTQTQLERYTEPVSAIAWSVGMEYPWHLLDHAWKLLMKNHPHDSICGCSCDEAHQQMESRFTQTMQLTGVLSKRAMTHLANEVSTDSETLVLHNPLGWKRTERVVADVDFPLTPPFRGEEIIDPAMEVNAFELRDPKGIPVPFSVVKIENDHRYIMHPQLIMHTQTVKRFTIEFWADDVPACGYKAYKVVSSKQFHEFQESADLCGDNWIGNEFVRLEFRNGSLSLTHRESGKTYSNLNSFEDCGEVGDEYRHIKPENDKVIQTDAGNVKFEIVRSNPISATCKIEQTLMLPESASTELTGRSDRLVPCPVTSYFTVARGVPRVDVRTEVENNAEDHRLRVVFPTGIKTDASHAESQFDVVTRPIKIPEDWDKLLASTWRPQLNWVDVNDGKAGLCLINKGLPEYELYDDEDRTLALTLLRCMSRLATLDIAHIAVATPDAQCKGKHVFEYSIYPHSGGWREAKTWKPAYEHNVPMRAVQTGAHAGQLPLEAGFVEVDPAELVVTAIKKAEREDKLVVRFFNTTDETVEGRATIRGAKSAELMNLNEDPQEQLQIEADGSVRLTVGKKKIVTVGFALKGPRKSVNPENERGAARPDLRGML